MIECVQGEGIIRIAKQIARSIPWYKPIRFKNTCRRVLPSHTPKVNRSLLGTKDKTITGICNVSKICFFYSCKVFYGIRGRGF